MQQIEKMEHKENAVQAAPRSGLLAAEGPRHLQSELAADAFAAALRALPADDWCRTWAAGRTIMLRRTSKRVKEVVDKMRLPAVVRLSRSFWVDARNGTVAERLAHIFAQLTTMATRCSITRLELPRCQIQGQDAERLAGVLAECPALTHLDLSWNKIRADGAGVLAGVLGQCPALAHLDLSNNGIEAGGLGVLAGVLVQCQALAHLNLSRNAIKAAGACLLAGVLQQSRALVHLNLSHNELGVGGARALAGVLPQCPALAHLNLSCNFITADGVESFARVLGQCRALAHLNFSGNQIRADGAKIFAGVLPQCPALAHLDLRSNHIGTDGEGSPTDDGVERLAGVLAQCQALAHLDLSNNGSATVERSTWSREGWRSAESCPGMAKVNRGGERSKLSREGWQRTRTTRQAAHTQEDRHKEASSAQPELLAPSGASNADDAEEEEEDCWRRDRDSADKRRHSELINLGAAGAGTSGNIGVCV